MFTLTKPKLFRRGVSQSCDFVYLFPQFLYFLCFFPPNFSLQYYFFRRGVSQSCEALDALAAWFSILGDPWLVVAWFFGDSCRERGVAVTYVIYPKIYSRTCQVKQMINDRTPSLCCAKRYQACIETRRSGDAAWVVGDPCPLSTFVHFCPFSFTSVYTLQYPNSRITSLGIPSHQGQID